MPEKDGLSELTKSLLCCLQSMAEGGDGKCNEATKSKIYRQRVRLVDNFNPTDKGYEPDIFDCNHWSIGLNADGSSQGRVRYLQLESVNGTFGHS